MQLPTLRKDIYVIRVALQCCVQMVAMSDTFVSIRQFTSGSEYSKEEVEVRNPIVSMSLAIQVFII